MESAQCKVDCSKNNTNIYKKLQNKTNKVLTIHDGMTYCKGWKSVGRGRRTCEKMVRRLGVVARVEASKAQMTKSVRIKRI